ncbi:MAG: acyltransferase family protein, partial [Actinomycetota bacterium]
MTAFSPAVAGSRTAEPWVDNLRVVVISGVIVGHTATAYVVDFPWYYDDERATSGVWTTLLSFPTVAGAIFWLGPLFLVAGWFSVRSLDRSGAAAFARSRLLRLGLPLAGYVAVVQPLTDYVGNLRGEQGSFVTYLRATEVGPMWFLAALLTFSLAYAGLRGVVPAPRRRTPASGPALAGAVLLIAGASLAVWQVWPWDAEMVLNLRVGEWPQGAVLFALGVRAGEAGWLADLTGRRVRRLGWVAAGGTVALSGLFAVQLARDDVEALLEGAGWPALLFALLDGVVAVAFTLWFVAWLRRRWSRHGTL